MALWRRLSGLALALAALSAAAHAADAQPDPAKLAQARSLVAEAVLLDRAEMRGRVTRAYAEALREDIAEGLKALKDAPGLSEAVWVGLAAVRARDDGVLVGLRDRLVAQERTHGRAD
jgi:hypothetical protein